MTGKGMALQQMRVVTPGICLLPLSLLALVALSNIGGWPVHFPDDGAGFSSGGAPWQMLKGLQSVPDSLALIYSSATATPGARKPRV